jgi:hypothetical protein
MDKPGGQDSQGFRRLVELCKSRSLALQLAYIYRYNPAIRFCLDAVKNRWIGDVFEVHAVMSRYDGDSPDYRKWLAQFQGGAMYVFAGYLLDLVISMLGRPQKVHSFPKRTRHDGWLTHGLAVRNMISLSAVLRFEFRSRKSTGMKPPPSHHLRHGRDAGTTADREVLAKELLHEIRRRSADAQVVRAGIRSRNAVRRLRLSRRAATRAADLEFAKVVPRRDENPFGYEHELLVQETLLEVSGCRPSN